MKFRDNVMRFMGGRYGNDQLGTAALGFCAALILVNIFVHSNILYALILAVMIWNIWRSMSRRVYERRRENEWFLSVCGKVKGWFTLLGRRWRDRKTHVYRVCPNCRKTLRLPRRKGSHTVSCPCCHSDFSCKVH